MPDRRKIAHLETWPHLRFTLHIFPWAWTFDPRRFWWRDAGITSSFTLRFLFIEVSWMAGRPMFMEARRAR
jgi:hypothetical protein